MSSSLPFSPARSSGDGHTASPTLEVPVRLVESASGPAADALAEQLDAARLLLREAAHVCRYHQPGLYRDIAAFLAAAP